MYLGSHSQKLSKEYKIIYKIGYKIKDRDIDFEYLRDYLLLNFFLCFLSYRQVSVKINY